MSSFLEEVRAEHITPGPRCGVTLFLADLDPELRADVETALADPRITKTAIYRRLVARGHQPPSQFTLSRHARGDCSCG